MLVVLPLFQCEWTSSGPIGSCFFDIPYAYADSIGAVMQIARACARFPLKNQLKYATFYHSRGIDVTDCPKVRRHVRGVDGAYQERCPACREMACARASAGGSGLGHGRRDQPPDRPCQGGAVAP